MGEGSIIGLDWIRDTSEKVSLIRQRLLTAQSRQKSYVDVLRRPLEFEVGDHVFLKVMPKGSGQVRQAWEAITEVHWTLRDTREGRHSCIPVSITAHHVRCSLGVSRLHAPEVYSRSSSCGGLGID